MKKIGIGIIAAVSLLVLGCSSTAPRVEPVREEPVPVPVQIQVGDKTVIVEIRDAAFHERPGAPERIIQAVSGTKNTEIDAKDVIITISNDSIKSSMAEGSGLNWITNLPAGLSATVRQMEAGSNTVTILVEGTPAETKNEPILITLPAEVMESGETLQVPANEDIRFDIAEAVMRLSAHPEPAALWTRDPNALYISGTVGNKLVPQDIQLILTDAALKEEILQEAAVSWITNLPAGLRAVVNPAKAGAKSLTLTVSGTPAETKDELVKIRIPSAVLGRLIDLDASAGDDIRFDIVGVLLEKVIISGFVGFEVNAKDVSIRLTGGGLKEDIPPGAVVNWITNLPAGLSARIKTAKAGEPLISLTVSGVPRSESQETLKITIPVNVLDRDSSFTAGINQEARFSIGSARQWRYGGIAGGSSNPYWQGDQVGPLNVPMLPAIKDFEGMGIVSVSSQTVEKLGSDNQYHWSGEVVNYAKLMLEAKKLGAHAIINVVVDYEDTIENNKVVRNLEADHVWTEDELEKIRLGILKEKTENGRRSVEENTRVITRTYTGTALAIRYIGGLNFLEAQRTPEAPKTPVQR
jgi:hypothetical protein